MIIEQKVKLETDGILLLRVMNFQTYKIGCVWKPGFVRSGHICIALTVVSH